MTAHPYERDGVPRPAVKVTVSDPMRHSSVDLEARIDTGFDGGLLIPLDHYLGLGLQLYEEPSSSFAARSALGVTVSLRSSTGVAQVEGGRFQCTIYTSPFLLHPLLGRDLLNRWMVTLDGPSSELTISHRGGA